jgi:hypothetical protein
MTGALAFAEDSEVLLRRQETTALSAMHEHQPLRCHSCGRWIAPPQDATVTLRASGRVLEAQFAHAWCAPARLERPDVGDRDPRGIAYQEALHPQAGAVLIWERTLDLRARGAVGGDVRPYLDAHRAGGFHSMLRDEPVRALEGWWLVAEKTDLVLAHEGQVTERFAGASARAAAGWLDAVRESGYCLLLVGSALELGDPAPARIQAAMRAGHAVMGLAEFRGG